MGHTYKDRKEEFRQDNRYFRKMPHYRKNHVFRARCQQTGKTQFPTEDDAQVRANEIIAEGNTRDGIQRFRIYQFEFCNLFHLTKQIS